LAASKALEEDLGRPKSPASCLASNRSWTCEDYLTSKRNRLQGYRHFYRPDNSSRFRSHTTQNHQADNSNYLPSKSSACLSSSRLRPVFDAQVACAKSAEPAMRREFCKVELDPISFVVLLLAYVQAVSRKLTVGFVGKSRFPCVQVL
jgi:hypothetical protein